MTTDDTPRPALDAGEIEEGRRLLAAATPGPWSVTMNSDVWNDGADYAEWVYGIAPILTGDDWAEPQEANAGLIVWLRNHADALLAAAAERDALAREAAQLREEVAVLCDEDQRKLLELERLRRAVALALDGPSDSEIGMETTLGRLNRIERQLRAALAPVAGEGDDGDR